LIPDSASDLWRQAKSVAVGWHSGFFSNMDWAAKKGRDGQNLRLRTMAMKELEGG
jgi:hypothetical protein